jgi:hypothetical protein
MTGMDDEPWREPEDDQWWRLPRSWLEVRERWASDYALRALIGIVVVVSIMLFFVCSGLRPW